MNELDNEKKIIYYGEFDWIKYVEQKKGFKLNLNQKIDIYNDYIQEESTKKTPIYFYIPKNTIQPSFFQPNNLDISFQEFPWESYLLLNNDLKNKGINSKKFAWNHWINFGKKEERAFSIINNTFINTGRFGNLFFVNMYVHFFSL